MTSPARRDAFLPLYERVKRRLRDDIEAGLLAPGQALPTEQELSGRFDVSSITVRRALQDLARDGVLKRVAGVGTFVRETKPSPRVALLLLGFDDVEKWRPRSKIFGDLMAGISRIAWESWSRFSLIRLPDQDSMREYLLDQIAWRSIDGILLKPNHDPTTETFDLLERLNLPFVVIKRASTLKPINCVVGDDFNEAKQLTQHLIRQGYRRIGFIGPPSDEVFRLRFGGYASALKEHNIALDESIVVRADDYDIEHGARWIDRILDRSNNLDSLFCGMGAYVGRVMTIALAKKGIQIGEGFGFVMHDPDNSGESFDPPVTSAGSSNFDLGHESAALLNRLLKNGVSVPVQLTLPPHVVIRSSTPLRHNARTHASDKIKRSGRTESKEPIV